MRAETDIESDEPRAPAALRFRVVGALAVAAGIAYLCRHPFGVAESTISAELGLSKMQSGILMGAFFWTYGLFQLPGGWLGHVWGARRALSLCAAGWSVAMFLTGISTTFVLLLLAQLLKGAAQAGIFPCSSLVIKRWLPTKERGLGQGAVVFGMQAGAIATAALTGWMLGLSISWRWIFLIYAVPGFIWAAWFVLRFREHPTAAHAAAGPPSKDPDDVPDKNAPTPWRTVFSHATMWFLCGQQVFRASGYMFFATWFPTFLQETRGISIEKSGLMQGSLLAAAMVGGLLGGVLTDRMYGWTGNLRMSRALLGAGGQLLCGLLILASYFVTSLPLAISLLATGIFFTTLGGTSALAASIDTGGKHVAKTFAVMNMSGNFAAAACPIFVGWIFDTTENWNIVLLIFAGIYLAAAACWFFINPTVDVTQPKQILKLPHA